MARINPDKVKSSIVDRVVGYFDPAAGLRRKRARVAAAAADAYLSSSRDRKGRNWKGTSTHSANSATLPDIQYQRDISHDLIRNAPLAAGLINTYKVNAIGPGLALSPKINRELLGLSEQQAADWQAHTKSEFRLWAESPDCDRARVLTFNEQQAVAFVAVLEGGDVFALTPHVRRRGPYKTTIQLIEADRVANPNRQADTPTFAGGIERDENGEPLRCHFLKTHPGELRQRSFETDPVPFYGSKTGRRNVIHVFEPLRPDQARGMPILAPVVETFKGLSTWTQAEIDATVLDSLFTVFIESEDGEELDVLNESRTSPAAGDDSWNQELGSGLVVGLNPGEKVHTAAPSRPNKAFDEFVVALLRQIGAATGMPLEILMMHFRASYSASRAALLLFWKFVRYRRAFMARRFCQPIYEEWLAEAVSLGRIVAPGFFDDEMIRRAYCGAIWTGDGPGALDPHREAQGVRERLAIDLTTLEDETLQYNGGDWSVNSAQRARERAAQSVAAPVTEQDLPDPDDLDNEGM